jgi:hypothetical protein
VVAPAGKANAANPMLVTAEIPARMRAAARTLTTLRIWLRMSSPIMLVVAQALVSGALRTAKAVVRGREPRRSDLGGPFTLADPLGSNPLVAIDREDGSTVRLTSNQNGMSAHTAELSQHPPTLAYMRSSVQLSAARSS